MMTGIDRKFQGRLRPPFFMRTDIPKEKATRVGGLVSSGLAMTPGSNTALIECLGGHFTSTRSRFITLAHARAKSLVNFSLASAAA